MPLFPKNPSNGQSITIGTRSWTFNSTYDVWDRASGSDAGPTGPTGPTGAVGPTGATGFLTVDNGLVITGTELSISESATIELVGIAHAGDANTKLVFGTDTVNVEAGGYRGISMNSSTVEVGGVTLGAGGITLGDSTNITSALRTDSYTGHIETVADKTYTIDPAAATARTITAFFIKSASGTVTATLKNGSDTIKAASVSDSSGAQTSLANTSVAADGVITIVTSSNSSALDVIFGIDYTS